MYNEVHSNLLVVCKGEETWIMDKIVVLYDPLHSSSR